MQLLYSSFCYNNRAVAVVRLQAKDEEKYRKWLYFALEKVYWHYYTCSVPAITIRLFYARNVLYPLLFQHKKNSKIS